MNQCSTSPLTTCNANPAFCHFFELTLLTKVRAVKRSRCLSYKLTDMTLPGLSHETLERPSTTVPAGDYTLTHRYGRCPPPRPQTLQKNANLCIRERAGKPGVMFLRSHLIMKPNGRVTGDRCAT